MDTLKRPPRKEGGGGEFPAEKAGEISMSRTGKEASCRGKKPFFVFIFYFLFFPLFPFRGG